MFLIATLHFGLPPDLLQSVCFIESHHNPNAIHRDDGGSDSIGICQIKLSTAKWLGFAGKPKDLLNPEVNIYYAAKYLKHLQHRYNGSVTKMLIAYNRGSAKKLTRTSYSDNVLNVWRTSENGRQCSQK